MFVLLQIYPLEAAGDDDFTPLDAIAVDSSEERLVDYLAGYQERYRAACAEFEVWDRDKSADWTPRAVSVSRATGTGSSVTL
jgi:hypothetical protein